MFFALALYLSHKEVSVSSNEKTPEEQFVEMIADVLSVYNQIKETEVSHE